MGDNYNGDDERLSYGDNYMYNGDDERLVHAVAPGPWLSGLTIAYLVLLSLILYPLTIKHQWLYSTPMFGENTTPMEISGPFARSSRPSRS